MVIIQQPDVVSLSANLKPFVISSSGAVLFTLTQGGETILSQRYEPNQDGRIEIDLRDVIESRLYFELHDIGTVYVQPGIVSNFTATIGNVEHTFRVLRGGVDRLEGSAESYLRGNFLTWQPTVKRVTYYTPEFLTYYATGDCTAKLRAYFTDDAGNVTSQADYEIASLSSGAATTLPLQYANVVGWLDGRLPAWYDVWIEAGNGDRLTYIQRYVCDIQLSMDEDWILFENSLGGIDTFRAYGDLELRAEHTHNVAMVEEDNVEYRIDTERIYRKNTGQLNKAESRWLLDFPPAKGKYLYVGNHLLKIVVTSSDLSGKLRTEPTTYSFSFKFAGARPLLNLQREDVPAEMLNIVVPDLGNFTLPPRLAEFPNQPLSEGVLFPVQSPYSEEWGVATFAALAAAIDVYLDVSGSRIDIIGENDDDQATDYNVFSALRVLKEIQECTSRQQLLEVLNGSFLRKDIIDTLQQGVQVGGCEITWDDTNNMLHFSTGIYADGGVSALGSNSSSGGSGGLDRETLFTILSGTPASGESINPTYIPIGSGLAVSNGQLVATAQTPDLSGYVTLATTQTISGSKNFSGGLTIDNNTALHAGNYTSYTYSSAASRTKNYVLAAPSSNDGAATFRKLVAADIPTGISITGNAATATTASKLGTSNVGSATKGIYLSAGTATEMTYSLNANINSGAENYIAYYSGANAISGNAALKHILETNTLTKPLRGVEITGSGLGNAADLLSGEAGVITYGDGGPQIRFTPSSTQHLALIATHYDVAGGGASLHLVSDQSRVVFTTGEIVAKTRLSIGVNTPNTAYPLYVDGNARMNRLYLASGVYLEYDSTNGGIHVVGAGLYSDSYVSSLGSNSSGSGSSGLDRSTLFSILSGTPASGESINTAFLNLSGYATQTWANNRYVTLATAQTISATKTFSAQQAFTVASGTAPFTVASSTLVSNLNADMLDGWERSDILPRGRMYSITASLADYWCKVWDYTMDAYNTNRRVTFLVNNGNGDTCAIIILKIRYNNSISDSTCSSTLVEVVGNIPLDAFRLYYDGTGYHALWANGSRYTGYSLVMLNKTSMSGAQYQSLGTMYNTTFTEAQTLPSMDYKSMTAASLLNSAASLTTARTIWGQSFDGSANVSGDMTGVGSVTMSGDLTATRTTTTATYLRAANSNGSIELHTATNRGIWDRTTSTWVIGTNGTYTWASQGNFGIGTTAPSYKLHVNGSLGCSTLYHTNNVSQYWKDSNGDDIAIHSLSSANNFWLGYGLCPKGYQLRIGGGSIQFYYGTSRTSGMFLSSSGNFGIGTTSPSQKLHVAGTIYATGGVTALSDMRMKNRLVDLNTPIEELARLPLFYFKYKNGDDGCLHIGTSAQAVNEILPELVTKKDTWGLDYSVLGTAIGILNSRQLVSHEDRIKALEQENEELRQRIKTLEEAA